MNNLQWAAYSGAQAHISTQVLRVRMLTKYEGSISPGRGQCPFLIVHMAQSNLKSLSAGFTKLHDYLDHPVKAITKVLGL